MLHMRSLARNGSGMSRALRPRSFWRFQASITSQKTVSPDVGSGSPSSASESANATPETQAQSEQAPSKDAMTRNETPDGAGRKKEHSVSSRPFNRKLMDISRQVRKSVDSATPAELSEAIDILEEGISYLREIQAAESIPEIDLYSVFQPITAHLFDKILDNDANLGSRSVESVLDMLVEQNIAHTYHFIKLQQRALQQTNDNDAYSRVLQLWVSYLEYIKQPMLGGKPNAARGAYSVYRERNYNSMDAINLAYFSMIVHCLRAGEDYDLNTIMKVLSIDDASRIPPSYYIVPTLNRLNLRDALQSDLDAFLKKVQDIDSKTMDPNSQVVLKKIDNLTKSKYSKGLISLYEDMKSASTLNSIPISEATLNRVMFAFIEMHRFDDALNIFASMLGGLIPKPSSSSWELVLKLLGHPSRIHDMSETEKEVTLSKVEQTFQTMQANGVPVNARVFGVFLGSLSNLNRQDLVAKYIEQHKDIPLIHLARNNILIGLVLNKNFAEAEKKMNEYAREDPSYVPSTVVMNTFLSHYVSEGNDKAVEGIIEFMRSHAIEENIATITTILSYYFKTFRNRGMIPDVHELLSELTKSSSSWDQFMVATLIDGLVKDGVNLDAARAVFKYFCETRRRFKHSSGMLTSMIKAEMEFGSLHNAEELFEWYIENLKNETVMWNMMIKGLLLKRESLAIDYYQRLCEQQPFNVAPNFYTYHFLLDHFLKKKQENKIQWVLDEIAAAKLKSLGNVLPRVIRRLSSNYNVAPELLETLREAENH